ncbi:hypothetical protein [Sphingomonas sp.]|uniref:hypothetical protein n=1 Tax=Sphingomonas sp. TaxID=28214 RepID=UPI0035A85A4D
MAMTKKERATLQRILSSIDRGLAFVDKPTTFLAVKTHPSSGMAFCRTVTAAQVEHCLRSDDPLAFEGAQTLYVIAKDIGSEFTLIRNARRELRDLLEPIQTGA